MDDLRMFPDLTRNPLAWTITLLLAALAWLPTLQQTGSMLSLPMYGTMGMALLPFLFFWTIMMVAMMLPALAPVVSVHVEVLRQQSLTSVARTLRLSAFLLGYLSVWCLFGLPVFLLGLLVDRLVLHAPLIGIGLGVFLFITVGLYQITPWKQQCLNHCNPALGLHVINFPTTGLVHLKDGLSHGLVCIGCCGGLMLILVAVGLMNLPWMFLITLLIFLEKVWKQGSRLRLFLGIALILFGLLAFIDPSLLPGLSPGPFLSFLPHLA